MKIFIRKRLLEGLNELRFNKIQVTLFHNSERTNTDYETSRSGSSSNSSKKVNINITPIIDLRGDKVKHIFDSEKGIDMSHISGFYGGEYGENVIILCKEGVLSYVQDGDSDCDGSSYSFTGDFTPHSKISEWDEIKNAIKPILSQSDIDNAVSIIGHQKQYCKVSDYGNIKSREALERRYLKKLEKSGKIERYDFVNDSNVLIKINGKYGLFKINGVTEKLVAIIPLIYDKVSNISKNKVKMRKGDIVYEFEKTGGKWVGTKKEDVNDVITRLKDIWQKKEPEISFDDFIKTNFGSSLSIYIK